MDDPLLWIREWERRLINWNVKYDVFPKLETIWGQRPSYVDDHHKKRAFQRWRAAVTRRSNNYWNVK